MFAGLLLASLSTLTVRAALFQRKSRSGWLEELDGIREDALVEPSGAVDDVVDGGDIWTDLRDGGEYADPHEISGLYASDDTPDLPAPRAAAAKAPRGRVRGRGQRPAEATVAAAPLPDPVEPISASIAPAFADVSHEGVDVAPAAHDHGQIVAEADGTRNEPGPADPVAAPLQSAAPSEVAAAVATTGLDPMGSFDREPAWVQPAPHPIRPSEMWHPADLGPPSLGEEPSWGTESHLGAADLASAVPPGRSHATSGSLGSDVFGSTPTGAAAWPDEVPLDPAHVHGLEEELLAAAAGALAEDVAVLPLDPTVPSEGGLVAGPVGRRVRRDRPSARPRAAELPHVAGAPVTSGHVVDPAEDISDLHRLRDAERSPLPEAPLPPAAIRSTAPAAPVEPPAPAVASTPAVAEPTPAVAPVTPLVPEADGLVKVPGTIVRLGGARRAAVALASEGAVVDLVEGWTWIAPGDGEAAKVVVDLPTARATVAPGATVLVVVEEDRSAFVFVAAGSVDLRRGDEGAVLARGSIAMLAPSGTAQVDQASDEELASDPIVAQNLAADAEL